MGYVRGVAQPRRAKWRIELDSSILLRRAYEIAREVVAGVVAGFLSADVCWDDPPRLAVLRSVISGFEVFADASICAPVSHPTKQLPDYYIDVVHICVEPIVPPGPITSWVPIRSPGVKQLGRVSIHGKYVVVKYRGLYWPSRARFSPDPLGGVLVMAARHRCVTGFDWVRTMEATRQVLRPPRSRL